MVIIAILISVIISLYISSALSRRSFIDVGIVFLQIAPAFLFAFLLTIIPDLFFSTKNFIELEGTVISKDIIYGSVWITKYQISVSAIRPDATKEKDTYNFYVSRKKYELLQKDDAIPLLFKLGKYQLNQKAFEKYIEKKQGNAKKMLVFRIIAFWVSAILVMLVSIFLMVKTDLLERTIEVGQ